MFFYIIQKIKQSATSLSIANTTKLGLETECLRLLTVPTLTRGSNIMHVPLKHMNHNDEQVKVGAFLYSTVSESEVVNVLLTTCVTLMLKM